MIPIKIQCGCGQRYAFDVEVLDGRMPHAVACPVCTADGTDAANAFITQNSGAQPAPSSPATGRIRVRTAVQVAAAPAEAAPAVATRPRGVPGKQFDLSQVTHEARAKMMWGDTQQQVLSFLMIEGLPLPEAKKLAEELFRERAGTVRKTGIRKILTGIAMIGAAGAGVIAMVATRMVIMTLLGALVMLAAFGFWTLLKGIFMVIAPKSESGNIYEA